MSKIPGNLLIEEQGYLEQSSQRHQFFIFLRSGPARQALKPIVIVSTVAATSSDRHSYRARSWRALQQTLST